MNAYCGGRCKHEGPAVDGLHCKRCGHGPADHNVNRPRCAVCKCPMYLSTFENKDDEDPWLKHGEPTLGELLDELERSTG